MSARTVIEINHDYLWRLVDTPAHESAWPGREPLRDLLYALLRGWGNDSDVRADFERYGVRILGQRHHSEKLELVVE